MYQDRFEFIWLTWPCLSCSVTVVLHVSPCWCWNYILCSPSENLCSWVGAKKHVVLLWLSLWLACMSLHGRWHRTHPVCIHWLLWTEVEQLQKAFTFMRGFSSRQGELGVIHYVLKISKSLLQVFIQLQHSSKYSNTCYKAMKKKDKSMTSFILLPAPLVDLVVLLSSVGFLWFF